MYSSEKTTEFHFTLNYEFQSMVRKSKRLRANTQLDSRRSKQGDEI